LTCPWPLVCFALDATLQNSEMGCPTRVTSKYSYSSTGTKYPKSVKSGYLLFVDGKTPLFSHQSLGEGKYLRKFVHKSPLEVNMALYYNGNIKGRGRLQMIEDEDHNLSSSNETLSANILTKWLQLPRTVLEMSDFL
jgi:hypothetical protein